MRYLLASFGLFLALLIGMVAFVGCVQSAPAFVTISEGQLANEGPCPGPGPCPFPSPEPSPDRPRPGPRPKSGGSWVNGRSHESEELAVDFPTSQHMQNIASRGLGMCVMTSIEMAARWAGLEQYRGLRDWCANQEAGGANPQKVDRQLAAYCRAKNLPAPQYLQYEGPDPGPILDLCAKTGRLACITYGQSPRYIDGRNPTGQIAHMTCCPHVSGQWGVCLDNNFIGGVNREHLFEWMPREELIRRMKYPGDRAWVFVWLAPSPPPAPRN
jgi:hypothetical protein